MIQHLGGSTAPGIGFAIPSNTVRDIATQLVNQGKVTSGTYVGFVSRITQQAQQRGVNATPTIFINGQLQQDPAVITSPSAFEAAVTHADQAAHR
jgi:S1-C subfamily serine protease